MNAEDLDRNFHPLPRCGVLLSTIEKSAMYNSLLLLRKNRRVFNFTRILFWGKITTGGRFDYLIVQGFDDALPLHQKVYCKNLYSKDGGVTFSLLPEIDDFEARKIDPINTMFTGDPSFVHIVAGGAKVSEEKRLAAVVQAIDHDCAIVPRGSMMLTSHHTVVPNTNFLGLKGEQVLNLDNYVHVRHVPNLQYKALLDRDFLTSIAGDLPQGCWIQDFDALHNVFMLRSFLWPGFTFFYHLHLHRYSYCYMGDGCKNNDFAFMVYTGSYEPIPLPVLFPPPPPDLDPAAATDIDPNAASEEAG